MSGLVVTQAGDNIFGITPQMYSDALLTSEQCTILALIYSVGKRGFATGLGIFLAFRNIGPLARCYSKHLQ